MNTLSLQFSSLSSIRSAAFRGRGRCSEAFTLLEVLLAVVILGAAVLVLMEGLSRSLNAVESIKNYNTATELLAMKLADLEKLETLEEGNDDGDFEDTHPGFTWTTEIASSELTDLYEVRATVFWSEHGQEASDSITTYLFRQSEERRRLSESTRRPGEAPKKR